MLILRYAKIIVFEKNPDLESKKNGLALIAALTSVALGILGVLLYIFLTGNRTNNYYSQVKVQDWGILASYVLLYLMVTSFASYKKPNWITFIVSNIIFILIATGLYLELKNHQLQQHLHLILVENYITLWACLLTWQHILIPTGKPAICVG